MSNALPRQLHAVIAEEGATAVPCERDFVLLLDNLISSLLPPLDTADKRLDIRISHPQVFDCLTGRRVLMGSGAVEDDRLVLFKVRQSRLEFLQGNRPLEHHRVAFRLILIGAYQDGMT